MEYLRTLFAELEDKGVRSKQVQRIQTGGRLAADLTDPDGNPLKLY